jgi:hypothetical protein
MGYGLSDLVQQISIARQRDCLFGESWLTRSFFIPSSFADNQTRRREVQTLIIQVIQYTRDYNARTQETTTLRAQSLSSSAIPTQTFLLVLSFSTPIPNLQNPSYNPLQLPLPLLPKPDLQHTLLPCPSLRFFQFPLHFLLLLLLCFFLLLAEQEDPVSFSDRQPSRDRKRRRGRGKEGDDEEGGRGSSEAHVQRS